METSTIVWIVVAIIIVGGIIALVVLFIVYQQNIVQWLRPFADWMKRYILCHHINTL